MGRYVKGVTATTVQCPLCSRRFLARPASIFAGNTKSCGCLAERSAARRRLTQREVGKRFRERGFVLLGKYVDSKTPVEVKCPLCNTSFCVRPNSVFTGRTRSCGCLQKKTVGEMRRLSIDEVRRRFVAAGFPSPSKYKGSNIRIATICPRCRKGLSALPERIFSGQTVSCHECSRELNGQRRWRDIAGLRHGDLVAIRPTIERKHQNVVWEVKCSNCASTVYLTTNEFFGQHTCGCGLRRIGKDNAHWKGTGEMPGAFWAGFLGQARREKKAVAVSPEECWRLFEQQGGTCALTGLKLHFGTVYRDTPTTASIDRIDSNKGYVRGNTQWVHKAINKMKIDLDLERFCCLCRLVTHPTRSTCRSAACEVARKHGNFRGVGNVSRDFWRKLLDGTNRGPAHSRRAAVQCTLTIQSAWDLFLKQRGRCALTGLELDFSRSTGRTKVLPGGCRKAVYVRGSASFDRIDSRRGYVPGNVQWVHKDINLMKWELGESEFKKWCALVTRHVEGNGRVALRVVATK